MNRVLRAGALGACLLAPRVAFAAWPSLEEAVTRARAGALAVTEANANVGVARSTMVGARLSPLNNPYVEVQADTSRATKDVAVQSFVFFPIELHGQRGARIDEASRFVDWRQVGLSDARAQATGEVIAAYGDVLVSSARIREAKRAEEEAKLEVSYFAQRLVVGDATLFEKSLSEAEVARWAQTVAEARVRLLEAQAILAQLTGAADVGLPPEAEPIGPPPVRTAWSAQSLAQLVDASPVLRAAQAEARYWDASRERLSREKNAPVNFIVNGGRGDAAEWRAGGGLSWTLPVTRRNQGEMARAEAERSRALQFFERARSVVQARASAAYETLVVSRDAVDGQDAAGIPATQRVVDASVALYRAGKGELLRVFIARRDLATARARRLDLLQLAWRAYGALAALKGELP